MRLRTLFIALLLLLITLFVVVNWPAIIAPTAVSLLVATVQAPLGLVMLGMLVVLVVAFVLYMALWQGTILAESRRSAKELQQQRALADQAEASRFNELRTVLHDEMTALGERLSQTRDSLRGDIREQGNSLAAVIAEMDERVGRSMPRG
ncbi:MAG: LapA family protein [Caldimonas sp.]